MFLLFFGIVVVIFIFIVIFLLYLLGCEFFDLFVWEVVGLGILFGFIYNIGKLVCLC